MQKVVLSSPVTETLLDELCSARTPAFLFCGLIHSADCFLLPQPLCSEQCLSCLEIFLSGLAEVSSLMRYDGSREC